MKTEVEREEERAPPTHLGKKFHFLVLALCCCNVGHHTAAFLIVYVLSNFRDRQRG